MKKLSALFLILVSSFISVKANPNFGLITANSCEEHALQTGADPAQLCPKATESGGGDDTQKQEKCHRDGPFCEPAGCVATAGGGCVDNRRGPNREEKNRAVYEFKKQQDQYNQSYEAAVKRIPVEGDKAYDEAIEYAEKASKAMYNFMKGYAKLQKN